jgi:hypothetical protein
LDRHRLARSPQHVITGNEITSKSKPRKGEPRQVQNA